MVGPIDSEDALVRAYHAIADGRADANGVEGAKVNALESIAWSLLGLLAKKVEGEADEEGIQESLQQLGLLRVDTK